VIGMGEKGIFLSQYQGGDSNDSSTADVERAPGESRA